MMVSLDSARLFYPREMLFAAYENHSQIAKLKRGEGGIYPSIRSTISQALFSSAGTPAGAQVSAPQKTSTDTSPTMMKNPSATKTLASAQVSPHQKASMPNLSAAGRSASTQASAPQESSTGTSPRTMQNLNAILTTDAVSSSREEIDRLETVSKPN